MTEINGLHLAYRGFVAGLAGGYIWAAIAMVLGALLYGDPLMPLRPIAVAITPLAGPPELAFVFGLAAVQAGGAIVGMCFAYFFARFFTVRATLRIAGPVVAVLSWALLAVALDQARAANLTTAHQGVAAIATIGFGLVLGTAVPVRGEVTRS